MPSRLEEDAIFFSTRDGYASTFAEHDPATGDVIAEVSDANAAHAKAAVDGSLNRFPGHLF